MPNTEPVFTRTPNMGFVRLAAANTASDGSGTLETLFTPGAEGSRLERVRYANSQVTPAASSAMVARIFITDNTGNNPRLVGEFAIATATRSASLTGINNYYSFGGTGLIIPTGCIIKVCQSVYAGVQDQVDYIAEGGDF